MWAEWRALTWEGTDPQTGRAIAARAQVVPIEDVRGVATYVGKYINKGLGKFYTSRDLERRKRAIGGRFGL